MSGLLKPIKVYQWYRLSAFAFALASPIIPMPMLTHDHQKFASFAIVALLFILAEIRESWEGRREKF